MKALSIRQPWAWAIVNGYKPVENRDTRFAWRGPILIHTGKLLDIDSMEVVRRLLAADGHDPCDLPEAHELPLGGFVGRGTLADCVTRHSSGWFFGPYGLVIEGAKPIPFKAWRGQLGLFDVADDELARLGIAPPADERQGRML